MQAPQENHLLAALAPAVQARLFPALEFVAMPLGMALYESGDALRYVYFPTDSIVSLLGDRSTAAVSAPRTAAHKRSLTAPRRAQRYVLDLNGCRRCVHQRTERAAIGGYSRPPMHFEHCSCHPGAGCAVGRTMVDAQAPVLVNRLIADLSGADRAAVLRGCRTVDLEFGTVLCEPEQTLRDVYFPLGALISLVTTVVGRPPLEMGMIGNEGMLGASLLLGVNVAPLQAVVQGPGTALRMTAAQLRRELGARAGLRATLGRYLFVLTAQLTQSAACTRFHEVDERLARWLLMTHDRAHADHFHLTHQFLADMLGVQRSAVTIAAGALQKKKIIRYVRGEIFVLSRKGLETASCACYAAQADHYRRLFK